MSSLALRRSSAIGSRALRDWLARAEKSKSQGTVVRYRKVINDFLDILGSKSEASLSDITPGDVQKFVEAQLNLGKTPSSVRTDCRCLNVPFALALRQGIILSNPVSVADVPREARESREPFTWDQVRKILKVVEGEWKTIFLLGAYTGARLGDCVSMLWGNVDLPNRLIQFRPAKTSRTKKDLLIPLHPELEDHLLRLSTSDSPTALLSPALAAQNIPGRSGLSRQFLKIVFHAGIENAAIEPKKKEGSGRRFRRFGFHSLRHTFSTQLANEGVAQEVRMALTGHSDERTHELYTHRGITTLRIAIEKMPDLQPYDRP